MPAAFDSAQFAFWPGMIGLLNGGYENLIHTPSLARNLTLLSAVLSLVVWFARKEDRKSRKTQGATGHTALPCFDDPTLEEKVLFDPRNWTMVRVSESEFQWKYDETRFFETSLIFDRDRNVLTNDLVFRGSLKPFSPSNAPEISSKTLTAAEKGADIFAHVSEGYGCVPSDYGGPMFLLPGLIIAAYVSGKEAREALFTDANRAAMIAYLFNHQQEDGGWGTHISGTSTNFGSVLNYAALRLLGVRATHPRCCKARNFLALREGALGAPLWAKLWLAVLGVYDYRGVSPVPPEMWLLPDWFPFHPGKTWCHARLVALPMSYLYGKRFVYPECETDATVIQLRTELYPNDTSYDEIEWEKYGDHLCGGELYGQKPSTLLVIGNKILRLVLENTWLGRQSSWLRSAALRRAWKHIEDEDKTNAYVDIGPVNKALNLVCAYAEGDQTALRNHIAAIHRYLWVAEDGMKMQGYINSMVWDTSFTLLGVCSILKASGRPSPQYERLEKIKEFASQMNAFLVRHQVQVDPTKTQEFRDPSKGGWGFSTAENTYIVSDCTAEALRAILTYSEVTGETPKADVSAAVNVILFMQNEDDGAWASYEKRRGYSWYEALNPAAVFGDIMIDYSYVECTSSCIQALVSYIRYQEHRASTTPEAEMLVTKCQVAVKRAIEYLFRIQREDGSWFGQWGVCFTYATLFAVEAIAAATSVGLVDKSKASMALSKAAEFLTNKQHVSSGGWGESVDSCALKTWVPDPSGPNVVNTAWAVLSLVRVLKSGLYRDFTLATKIKNAAEHGARFLVGKQLNNGDWLQQSSISGVFNKTCGITYSTYRNSFSIWALAEFSHLECSFT